MTNAVRKNPEAVKAMAKGLFNIIRQKHAPAAKIV
jgi:hypothetical protein